MTNKHVKYVIYVINSYQDNKGKSLFYKNDPYDLDLWSNNPNVGMGHVSIKTNQHVKI